MLCAVLVYQEAMKLKDQMLVGETQGRSKKFKEDIHEDVEKPKWRLGEPFELIIIIAGICYRTCLNMLCSFLFFIE